MCDYSLRHLNSRPAKVDDKLIVSRFSSTSSIGFCCPEKDAHTVVCVMPGTELAFADKITQGGIGFFGKDKIHPHKTARFRQVYPDNPHTHHDALELPDGKVLILHSLKPGQVATVLQLPAAPKTAEEAKAQERLPIVV